jgi:hypothetical protein
VGTSLPRGCAARAPAASLLTGPHAAVPPLQALRQSLGETGLPDIGRAVELAELLDSDGDEAAAAAPQRSAAAAAAAAAMARFEAGDSQQQQLPQRGWEQPAAVAAGLQRGGLPPAPPAVAAGAARGGRGHIRGQQQQGEAEAEQAQRQGSGGSGGGEAGGSYNIEGFLSQLDRQLQGGGGSGDISAGGSALGRSGSGSGSGGSVPPGGDLSAIRQPASEMRLPPLPPGRRFADEYEVGVVGGVPGVCCSCVQPRLLAHARTAPASPSAWPAATPSTPGGDDGGWAGAVPAQRGPGPRLGARHAHHGGALGWGYRARGTHVRRIRVTS